MGMVLDQGLMDGYVAIGDRDYDNLRRMSRICHRAGFPTLR
ncbi:MAG: hypothetical protein KatS3mg105_4781 [Gemmatales bacterium]|nr:MAG: hypothetical protein KatS3mg105_4781 [Gemmatales bacterium]